MGVRILAAILVVALFTGCTQQDHNTVDFGLPDLQGNPVRLSDYRGHWVVVNFWATWCLPCLQEIPELIKFHKKYATKNAMVIGVNFEEIDISLLFEFVRHKDINYPVVKAGKKPVIPFEPLKGLPSTFLINPDGQLVASHIGAVTMKMLTQLVEKNGGKLN